MDCNEFRKYMPDFALNRLEYEKAAKCLHHVKNCSSCKDEFEIFLIVEKGIRDDSADVKPFILKDVMADCFNSNEQRIIAGRRKHFLSLVFGTMMYLITFAFLMGFLFYLI